MTKEQFLNLRPGDRVLIGSFTPSPCIGIFEEFDTEDGEQVAWLEGYGFSFWRTQLELPDIDTETPALEGM